MHLAVSAGVVRTEGAAAATAGSAHRQAGLCQVQCRASWARTEGFAADTTASATTIRRSADSFNPTRQGSKEVSMPTAMRCRDRPRSPIRRGRSSRSPRPACSIRPVQPPPRPSSTESRSPSRAARPTQPASSAGCGRHARSWPALRCGSGWRRGGRRMRWRWPPPALATARLTTSARSRQRRTSRCVG